MQESALIAPLAAVVPIFAADSSGDGGFHGPEISEFFPAPLLFAGTPFELNRITAIRLLAVVVLLVIMWLGSRRMAIVPGRAQVAFEAATGFVRKNIVVDTLGEKDGKRYEPLLMTIFFLVLATNITGIVPGLQIAASSTIGLPIVLAVITWVVFIAAGVGRHGLRYFRNALILPGVPIVLVPFLALLEFLSTFIVRPITLTLRLLMNVVAGHMLLVLVFSATHFFFFTVLASGNPLGVLGVGTFAFGIVFLLLELFVAALQAYVFAILTAIYIQLSLADSH